MKDKITGESTLGDLAMRRGALGITELMILYASEVAAVVCYVKNNDGHYTRGTGETEAEAINAAFDELTRKIGETLTGMAH